MVDRTESLPVTRQCELLDLPRSTFYHMPKRNLSLPAQAHKVYPYLLKDLVIDRPNQVWATDITYIPMARGFVYLVAIIDWYSRRVLSWRVSNTLDTSFCVDALNETIETYGAPEIFNTDQGSQFTSENFTGALKDHDIRISMDGKDRWADNVFVERLCFARPVFCLLQQQTASPVA